MNSERPILEFRNIGKSFLGIRALNNVSFDLKEGHILGLVGQNGAGKSTLMNILGGVVPHDEGHMLLSGKPFAPANPSSATKAGIAFIHQELNLFPNLSVADNLFIHQYPRYKWLPLIDRRKAFRRAAELLSAVDLSIPPDLPVERLSPGERQLVETARAIGSQAKLIIFDEPTTSLTARETERLFQLVNRLKSEGKSLIYISHNLDDVLRLADDIVILRDGEVVGLGHQDDFDARRMISLMVGRDIEQLFPPRVSIPSDEVVLNVQRLSQSGVIRDIHFSLHRGEVLGLFGLMGSGRSELARILFGLDSFESGRIEIEGHDLGSAPPQTRIKKGMAFVTEDRRENGLLIEASVLENISLVALPKFARRRFNVIDDQNIRMEVKNIAEALHLKCSSLEHQPVRNLSGGNQQKTVIGKWLIQNPSVFIMDEPTRGIDVGAKFEVYTLVNDLAAKGTGVLFVSSEIEELTGMCDRILVMAGGQIVDTFEKSGFNQELILQAAFRQSSTTKEVFA